jgi:Dehydratase medium subunit
VADYTPMSEDRRPSVRILMSRAAALDLQGVFWGLEEEGIPVDVHEAVHGNAVVLAKEAAQMSPLNVGIGVDGREGTLALHHRDLPEDHPLFVLRLSEVGSRELRKLGTNAARLVKAEPLVLEGEPVDLPNNHASETSAAVSNELFERMVQSVLRELATA